MALWRWGRRGGEGRDVFVEDCLRPFCLVPPGRGGEVDHQPVDEQLQAGRLVPGVEVGRQFARLYRVRDSCGERFLQPLRGVIGGGGEFGYYRGLRQEGEQNPRFLAPALPRS